MWPGCCYHDGDPCYTQSSEVHVQRCVLVCRLKGIMPAIALAKHDSHVQQIPIPHPSSCIGFVFMQLDNFCAVHVLHPFLFAHRAKLLCPVQLAKLSVSHIKSIIRASLSTAHSAPVFCAALASGCGDTGAPSLVPVAEGSIVYLQVHMRHVACAHTDRMC